MHHTVKINRCKSLFKVSQHCTIYKCKCSTVHNCHYLSRDLTCCQVNKLLNVVQEVVIHKQNTRALRERKPPPMPKFQPKVISDLNPDFRTNPDADVCQICPKMLWMHYWHQSSRQVWYKSAIDWGCSRSLKMMRFNKPYTTFYWSAIVNIALSCTVSELYLTLNNIATLKYGLQVTQGH